MDRRPKPSGWKGKRTDQWWTKHTAYGVKYMCPDCRKETLGIMWGEAQRRMHYASCVRLSQLPAK